MSTRISELMMLLPCEFCRVGAQQPCQSKSGAKVAMHSARWYIARRWLDTLSAAWKEGHTACTHSCLIYDGLGEPCHNPYEAA